MLVLVVIEEVAVALQMPRFAWFCRTKRKSCFLFILQFASVAMYAKYGTACRNTLQRPNDLCSVKFSGWCSARVT